MLIVVITFLTSKMILICDDVTRTTREEYFKHYIIKLFLENYPNEL